MNVYEAILKRRTIRRFSQKPIPPEILDKLINAARLAPSAANLQPSEYIVVDEPGPVSQVFSTLHWAGYIVPEGNPPPGERPVAYIIVLTNNKKAEMSGVNDAAAAIENILLAALEEGIGSCWLGSIEREVLQKLLDVPDHCLIDSVIALGYPRESPAVEEMKDSIKYWKDEEGLLHVPKRKLADILHWNKY
ncbi:nitroreductase family protein [candidate division NPL-UPA2 bacterium]|nr:nitroreductase family protein [candidate division NPL-UPA2 bacterium]